MEEVLVGGPLDADPEHPVLPARDQLHAIGRGKKLHAMLLELAGAVIELAIVQRGTARQNHGDQCSAHASRIAGVGSQVH